MAGIDEADPVFKASGDAVGLTYGAEKLLHTMLIPLLPLDCDCKVASSDADGVFDDG